MRKVPLSFTDKDGVLEALGRLVRWADEEDGVFLSRDGGDDVAVVLSIDHYESIMALFDLASDPNWLKKRYEAIEQGPSYSELKLPLP